MERSAGTADAPARRSLKERQREERAALILEAAQDVFAAKGYHDASIDEIAARVGIAKGTVYLHFASKEELVVALIEEQIARFVAMIDEVSASGTSVRARLEEIVRRSFVGLRGKRTQVLLELNNSAGITKSVVTAREGVRDRMAAVTAGLSALLAEGQRSGELVDTIPVPVMLAAFRSLISPRGWEQLMKDEQLEPEEAVRYVSAIFFGGVAAPHVKDA